MLTGAGSTFYQRFKRLFGLEPEPYAANAYDATGAVLQAIARAGTLDRSAIVKEALATRDYQGAMGRWSFDSLGDIDLNATTRIRVVDGKFGYVGTNVAKENAPELIGLRS